MGCSTCAKKKKPNLNIGVQQMQAFNFAASTDNKWELKQYVGPTGEVDSVVAGLNYGNRTSGQSMYVHVNDIAANPNLFIEIPEPKVRRKKDVVLETEVQDEVSDS